MTQDLLTQLDKTKGQLFFKKGAGFLGSILAKINVTFDVPEDVTTAAISDSTLYWNPEFFLSRDKDTRVTVLAHELWHNALLHGARLNGRCPDIWNQAADHVINLMLGEHGYDMSGFPYLMDPRFRGMTTDEVYDILFKEGGKPMPHPMSGDIMPMDAADVPKAIASVVAAMATARITGKPGDIPGELSMVIDNFLEPKLPWETLLFNWMNALSSDEYSYAKPNRRYQDWELVRPSLTGRNGLEHLLYFVDISGSISDDQVLRMNSEVKHIQEELNPDRLSLITFDTQIHDIYEFERDEPFTKIEITGRGGTDLKDVFKYAKKTAPTAMIVFTDLEVDIPPDPGIPLLWVCVDAKFQKVPYGNLVHLET